MLPPVGFKRVHLFTSLPWFFHMGLTILKYSHIPHKNVLINDRLCIYYKLYLLVTMILICIITLCDAHRTMKQAHFAEDILMIKQSVITFLFIIFLKFQVNGLLKYGIGTRGILSSLQVDGPMEGRLQKHLKNSTQAELSFFPYLWQHGLENSLVYVVILTCLIPTTYYLYNPV